MEDPGRVGTALATESLTSSKLASLWHWHIGSGLAEYPGISTYRNNGTMEDPGTVRTALATESLTSSKLATLWHWHIGSGLAEYPGISTYRNTGTMEDPGTVRTALATESLTTSSKLATLWHWHVGSGLAEYPGIWRKVRSRRQLGHRLLLLSWCSTSVEKKTVTFLPICKNWFKNQMVEVLFRWNPWLLPLLTKDGFWYVPDREKTCLRGLRPV